MGRRLLILAGLVAVTGCGASIDYRGYSAADGRAFVAPPKYEDQASGNGVSLVAEPELYLVNDDHLVTVRPFLRFDPFDEQRTHWDLRRADYVLTLGNWELGAGLGQFRWGVLEAFRVADVLNQIDYVEDFDGSQRLGQPYAQVGWLTGDWVLRLYALPYFREATFPGAAGRMRLAAVVDGSDPIYETGYGAWQPSFAARVSGFVGDFDLGFGVFTGVSREARFVARLTEPGVVPAYDLAHQASADVTWSHEGLSVKVETMGRLWSTDLRFFFAVAGGVDYTFFDAFGSGADLTLATEYVHDTRPPDAARSLFTRDAFAGFRLALNDTAGTTVTGGAITDVLDLTTYLSFRAQRRFGTHWKIYLELNAFLGTEGGLESALRNDHHGQLRLAYFF